MQPLAHSARPAQGIPAQSYAEHICAVFDGSVNRATCAARFAKEYGDILRSAVGHASTWHDLGKLEPANQVVLGSVSRKPLPINHCDAGVACVQRTVAASGSGAEALAAFLVYAHHIGFPTFAQECARGVLCLRDQSLMPDGEPLSQHTDAGLARLILVHQDSLRDLPAPPTGTGEWLRPLLWRIALSCLVDADHTDTARHYGETAHARHVTLRAKERLEVLDRYVERLALGMSDERTKLRQAVYGACRNAAPQVGSLGLCECDSPVGTGKTTAVMANLLRVAEVKGLRRVFVVLPYTNIIDQSVDVYRRSCVLPDEDTRQVVVPHHHKAEFENYESRQFAALWSAPIIVTTAVQFFETLAGYHPAALRKLHQLPGSAIFIDESHAALPARLWPRAWAWLKQLATDWGCHVVLGSGSLNRAWKLPEVDDTQPDLPPLVQTEIRTSASLAERSRVLPCTRAGRLSLTQLLDWVMSFEGPRLVIVNTVQTAAAFARLVARKCGRCRVEHLSTALTPSDRDNTLQVIKARLAPSGKDSDWTLIATSCVEAGVDISFRIGFRERAGLTNLLQTAGRVNRSNEYASAQVWDFELSDGELVVPNPALADAAKVLGDLFAEKKVDPAWCTEALRREIQEQYSADLERGLRKAEEALDFREVARRFKVIDQPTITAVADPALIERLTRSERVSWPELQRGSVQMFVKKAEKFLLPASEFPQYPELYRWNLEYDGFLGYMAGGLKWLEAESLAGKVGFIV